MKMGLGPGLCSEDGTGSMVFRVQGLRFRLVGVGVKSGTRVHGRRRQGKQDVSLCAISAIIKKVHVSQSIPLTEIGQT